MRITQESPSETRERCKAASAVFYGDKIEFTTGGGTFLRHVARGIFEKHGLGASLPADPRPNTVLVRAMREGSKPKGYIARKFVSPNPDTPMAVHVTKVGAGHGEAGDEYTCLARVRISTRKDPASGLTVPYAVAKPPEGQDTFSDNVARDRALAIAKQANVLFEYAQNKDLGNWLRSALGVSGCVQSLGRGNNYYVPEALVDTYWALFSDAQAHLKVTFVRNPQTSTGASHVRQTMAAAATISVESQFAKLRERLTEVTDKDGKKTKGTSLKAQIAEVKAMAMKLDLYQDVFEKRALAPIEAARAELQSHFDTLVDGGAVSSWAPAADAATPVAPLAEPAAPEPVAEEPAAEEPDPFAWCAG